MYSTIEWNLFRHVYSEGLADQEQPVVYVAREDDMSRQQRNFTSSRIGETSQNLPHVNISNNQKVK